MTGPDLSELLDLAVTAARAAGDLLVRGRAAGPPPGVSSKASPRDLVSDLDRASEALIVRHLLTARPADGLLGEEGALRAAESGIRWVIDPLDGTSNYLHGLPSFVVSIAAESCGVTVVGVVHDPSRHETFTAIRGNGAHLNGHTIRASGESDLSSALLGTGFSHDLVLRADQFALLGEIALLVRDVRHSGSAALDLCSVAAGRLDVYYEGHTSLWDRAAGVLIAEEAGAAVGGTGNGPPSDELTIAGAPPLVAAVRDLADRNGSSHGTGCGLPGA